MLHIVYKPRVEGLHGVEQMWHVGEDLTLAGSVYDVQEVQADGDELVEIYEQDLAYRSRVKNMVRWFGDQAKYIVANLKVG